MTLFTSGPFTVTMTCTDDGTNTSSEIDASSTEDQSDLNGTFADANTPTDTGADVAPTPDGTPGSLFAPATIALVAPSGASAIVTGMAGVGSLGTTAAGPTSRELTRGFAGTCGLRSGGALRAAVPVARIGPVTALADLPLIASGKVREIYDARDQTLLIVASDRISTYDVVHPTPIPDKGGVLTGLSTFWFERTAEIVPNHLLSVTDGVPAEARGRGMLVRKLEMLPVECVVRGYITGSGWKDYQRTGDGLGHRAARPGLRESDQLPEPIFTPSTKAEVGHDEAIDFERTVALIGDRALAERAARRLDRRLQRARPSTPASTGSSSPTPSSSSGSTPTAS